MRHDKEENGACLPLSPEKFDVLAQEISALGLNLQSLRADQIDKQPAPLELLRRRISKAFPFHFFLVVITIAIVPTTLGGRARL